MERCVRWRVFSGSVATGLRPELSACDLISTEIQEISTEISTEIRTRVHCGVFYQKWCNPLPLSPPPSLLRKASCAHRARIVRASCPPLELVYASHRARLIPFFQPSHADLLNDELELR